MAGRAIGKTEKAEKLLRVLEQFAEYDSVNGGFVVTKFRGGHSKQPGESLGSPKFMRGDSGAVCVCINYTHYRVHRLVWLWHYGEWPKHEIDHIDQDWKNNKIENLRDVSSGINNRNAKLQKSNTSGVNGVSWEPQLYKWRARIVINDRTISLGCFNTLAQAAAARKAANEKYGFSSLHGKNR